VSRWSLRAVPLVVLALCNSLSAAGVEVTVTTAEAARGCLAGAVIVAAPDERGARVEVPLEPAAPTRTLQLADAREWTLSVSRADCWSETRHWLSGDEASLTLRVYNLARVSGVFETGKPAALPARLTAVVYPQDADPGSSSAQRAAGLRTSCTLKNERWQCEVPANLPIDLRMDVPGFAAVRYWDIAVPAGTMRELEPSVLRPGASISGWVQDPREKPVARAGVTAIPVGLTAGQTRQRTAVRLFTTRTNARGFFELTGLDADKFKLVAESPGLSPAVLTEVGTRAGESLMLPRAMRLSPFGEAEIMLDPPADGEGRSWRVELTETSSLYPDRPPASIEGTAPNGRWLRKQLRADAYDVVVRNAAGVVVQRSRLDLFGGGLTTLQITVHPVVLRGRILAGDRPLQADLQLYSTGGKTVRASADSDGRFETLLPVAGEWKATVLYPQESSPARIDGGMIQVPSDVPEAHEVELNLPGGRLFGRVRGQDGTSGRAAVHALRNGQMAAQQMADESGTFDLIGLSAGTYQLDAQNAAGTTPKPIDVDLRKNESREVELITEPSVMVTGVVLTPDGQPASGAAIRISENGESWVRLIADIRGRFEHPVSRASTVVQIAVLTYSFPAAFIAVSADGRPIQLTLRRHGGLIRFAGGQRGWLSGNGVSAPSNVLFFPEPGGRFNGAFFVEPGAYVVCRHRSLDDSCRRISILPGSEHTVDFSAPEEASRR
jgi:hypothetical protein